MSSSESDSGETISNKQNDVPAELNFQDKPSNKVFETVTEGRAAPGKKSRNPKEGRVSKPKRTVARSSQPRNAHRQRESRLIATPTAQQIAKDANSFYRGALLGSFLGATLTTVVTNLVAKAFQTS
ncbi:hypothetical protein HG536_0A01470 [Torulaspora globosa]|uniref:Uncharacterized protein n=1 Tax=Torulaspora globosa TaxID=48254 RepID=A0A7G3Z9Z4_9SACH|nr:uncharacterized protein HG536_0A01470 [Torulaspora globosa]QLL30330.1 hypothetical protein HG536_0A01470 [Torulaspora globosa]